MTKNVILILATALFCAFESANAEDSPFRQHRSTDIKPCRELFEANDYFFRPSEITRDGETCIVDRSNNYCIDKFIGDLSNGTVRRWFDCHH